MFRELAVLLFVAGIASAGKYQRRHYTRYSTTTQTPLEVSSVTNSISYDNKPLQYHEEVSVISPAKYVQEYVAQQQGISSQEAQSGTPVTYDISAAVVKTIPVPTGETVSVPVANKIAVEHHQHVTTHPTSAVQVSSEPTPVVTQPVHHHVQNIQTPHAIPLVYATPKPIVTVTTHPSIATSTLSPQPIHVQHVAHHPVYQYVPVNQGVVNTVSTVPVQQNKVTVEAHQSVTAHPSPALRPIYPIHVVNPPAVQIVSSSVAQNPPPAPATSGIYETVTFHPPAASYVASSHPQPLQHVQNLSPAPATSGIYETVTFHPPAASYVASSHPQPLHHVQTVVNRPTAQYVSAPINHVRPAYVNPKPVTVETHQSVISHPPRQVQTAVRPEPVQYTSTPASPSIVTQKAASVVQHGPQVQYATSTPPPEPIPVRAIFTAEEAQNPQYVTVTTNSRPASSVVSQLAPVPVPVSVAYPNGSFIKYSTNLATPLVYTKSIVDKDHLSADLVASQIAQNYGSYARALSYSPATSVSSVSFNGLGVSYGW